MPIGGCNTGTMVVMDFRYAKISTSQQGVDRAELNKALDELREGEVLVVAQALPESVGTSEPGDARTEPKRSVRLALVVGAGRSHHLGSCAHCRNQVGERASGSGGLTHCCGFRSAGVQCEHHRRRETSKAPGAVVWGFIAVGSISAAAGALTEWCN